MYVIKASNIGKRFGDFSALHNINMRLGTAETIVLLGPNGAGKSTLLKILAGLYKPTAGTVEVFGNVLPKHADKIRNTLSFLGENYALYDDLTVRQNLFFFGRLYDLKDQAINQKIRGLLIKFDALMFIDKKVGELSRGTKQKIAICRALINNPRLLLLDEPSAFLDPVASRILHNELNTLSKSGVSIVYATQRLDELYKIGNKTLLLRKGKEIAFGNADQIINRLKGVEVEVLLGKAATEILLNKLKRKWKVKLGDSDKAIVFSLNRINQIPKVVKDVVDLKGEIVSVLYLKESIDRILSGD